MGSELGSQIVELMGVSSCFTYTDYTSIGRGRPILYGGTNVVGKFGLASDWPIRSNNDRYQIYYHVTQYSVFKFFTPLGESILSNTISIYILFIIRGITRGIRSRYIVLFIR